MTATYAKTKSYLVSSKKEPGFPALVAQFTEGQVGAQHADLLESLASITVERGLNRAQIKELRDAVLAKHRFSNKRSKPNHPTEPCNIWTFGEEDRCMSFFFVGCPTENHKVLYTQMVCIYIQEVCK